MKKFILLFALTVTNAFAVEIPFFEINAWRTTGQDSIEVTYDTNEELGRAWAEIEVYSSLTSDSGADYYRAQVPGLSLQGDNIVLDAEGTQTVCAVLEPRGIFRYKYPKATGRCKFVVTSKTVLQDDGFEIRKVKYFVVSLVTK